MMNQRMKRDMGGMMGDDRGLPPPSMKGRSGPEMTPEDPSTMARLAKLAQGGDEAGLEAAGGGDEAQASQHLMNGIQELMAAAQSHPQLGQLIMPLLQELRNGMSSLTGGGGRPSFKGPPASKRRPPKRERGEDTNLEEEDEY